MGNCETKEAGVGSAGVSRVTSRWRSGHRGREVAQKETQLKEDRSGDHRDWKWVEKSGAIHLTWRGLKVSVKTQAWPEARLQGLFS